MINNIKSPDTLQQYISIGIILHPAVLHSMYMQMREMEYKKTVYLLPQARLEHFSLRVMYNIEQKRQQLKTAA